MRIVILALLVARTAAASPLADALHRAEFPFAVTKGKLDGKGGEVLRTAIDAAQFVVIGSATPALRGAVCTELASHGFHHLVLEIPPSAARERKEPACPGYDVWGIDAETKPAGDSYDAIRERARTMKGTFLDDLSAAAKAEKAFPKALLALDGERAYRGLNPRRSSEMGNLIGEAAEGHKVVAVNLLAIDKTDGVFAPFAGKGSRLFDLRTLRAGFASLGVTDPELERVIFGFDFLLVTP